MRSRSSFEQNRESVSPENSLRLDASQLRRLVEVMDADEAQALSRHGKVPGLSGMESRRAHRRWPFLTQAIRLTVEQLSGGTAELHVATRNLSCSGMAVLHVSYMHEGTRVHAELPRRTGSSVEVSGHVARCQHRRGMVHEIGIRFDQALEIESITGERELVDRFEIERVDPERLMGRVLVVDDSAVDRELIAAMLEDTRLDVMRVGSASRAMEAVETGCDLILCDFHLPDRPGVEFVERVRSNGIMTPVIMITADTSPFSRRAMSSAAVDAVLYKPIDAEQLRRAVATYVKPRRGDGLVGTPLVEGDAAWALAPDFVVSLHRAADELEGLQAVGDLAQAVDVCRRVSASAASFGFAELGRRARELRELFESVGVVGAGQKAKRFVLMLRQTRAAA